MTPGTVLSANNPPKKSVLTGKVVGFLSGGSGKLFHNSVIFTQRKRHRADGLDTSDISPVSFSQKMKRE